MNQQVEAKAREILKHVRRCPIQGAPSQKQLLEISAPLIALARSAVWKSSEYREASLGEELLYELAVSPIDGPALYLVSDGASVSSAPHRHDTWAVIVGIRGYEVNHFYGQQSGSEGAVAHLSKIEVGPLSVLALHEQDIHSTVVRGQSATFHLHLYGRALHSLPSFSSRCYRVAGAV